MKIAVACGSLLIALFACEVGLRLAGYAPLAKNRGDGVWRFLAVSDDPVLAYELVPGARGHGFDTEIEVNETGFRGPAVAIPKPAGTRRVVVLGDSVTFGNGLLEGETYPALVESLLVASGRPVEVCNLALTGYDTLQMARTLDRTGLRLQPDVIVVGYCFNDVGTVSIELTHVQDELAYRSPVFRLRLAQWLRARYRQWQVLRNYYDRNRDDVFRRENEGLIEDLSGDPEVLGRMAAIADSIAQVRKDPPGWSPLPWYASAAHVGKMRRAFRELARVAGEAGVPVLVAILPSLKEAPFLPAHELAYELVAAEAQRNGFDVLRLSAVVRAADPTTLTIHRGDWIHLNAAGHRLIANRLAHWLVTRGYLG